jgi:hypothetical protein
MNIRLIPDMSCYFSSEYIFIQGACAAVCDRPHCCGCNKHVDGAKSKYHVADIVEEKIYSSYYICADCVTICEDSLCKNIHPRKYGD